MKASRLRYFMAADESGGVGDDLRVLALLSGPGQSLLNLERRLRGVLKDHGQAELKWARLRKRPEPLAAACDFLALANEALGQGSLRLHLAVYRPGDASRAWSEMDEPSRLLELYAGLARRAKRAWGKGRFGLYPDQRTGMAWGRLRRKSLWSLREQASHQVALVQLADLLAGLTRFEALGRPGKAALPAARRGELLDLWKRGGSRGREIWRVRRLDSAPRPRAKGRRM